MTAATAPTPTAPRRPLNPWIPTIAVAVLIGILAVSGARLTWDTPTVTVQGDQVTREVSPASVERANALAAAHGELTALRNVIRQTPSVRQAMHDRMQLLAAVGAGHVPVEALERRDGNLLHKAVRAGHVPTQALNPRE